MNKHRDHQLEPPLDFEELCANCLGKREFARKMLDQFTNSLPDYFGNIPVDIDESNLAAIFSDAHRLKGTASTLAAHAISAAATEVDAAARLGDFQRTAESYPLLLREIDRMLEWMRQLDSDQSEQ